MAWRRNLSQISPKFWKLQEALANAKTPEEKIEIMLALCPEEKRDEERKNLLAKLEEWKANKKS